MSKLKIIILSLASVTMIVAVGGVIFLFQLDAAFEDTFKACNEPPISSEKFELACSSIGPGADINIVISTIDASLANSKCINDVCTLHAQGGSGMFCDICFVKYNKKNHKVVESVWVYGDD